MPSSGTSIDKCLAEAAEVDKSIQLSRIGRREPMKQKLKFKPVNIYGSTWLRRIEYSSDPPKVKLSVTSNDQRIEDIAKDLISQEMARYSQSFIYYLETPGCLIELQSHSTSMWNRAEATKESDSNDSNVSKIAPCQTPMSVRQDPPLFLRSRQ